MWYLVAALIVLVVGCYAVRNHNRRTAKPIDKPIVDPDQHPAELNRSSEQPEEEHAEDACKRAPKPSAPAKPKKAPAPTKPSAPRRVKKASKE